MFIAIKLISLPAVTFCENGMPSEPTASGKNLLPKKLKVTVSKLSVMGKKCVFYANI